MPRPSNLGDRPPTSDQRSESEVAGAPVWVSSPTSACSDHARDMRASRNLNAESLTGQTLDIDGFNLLTSIEAAPGGWRFAARP